MDIATMRAEFVTGSRRGSGNGGAAQVRNATATRRKDRRRDLRIASAMRRSEAQTPQAWKRARPARHRAFFSGA